MPKQHASLLLKLPDQVDALREEAEIAALPPSAEVFHVEQLQVPELAAERCIVWMRKRLREKSATGPASPGS